MPYTIIKSRTSLHTTYIQSVCQKHNKFSSGYIFIHSKLAVNIFIQFILYYSPQIPCILSSFIYIFYGNLSFFYLLFISVSLFSATIRIPELLIQKKRRTQETSPPVSGASVCFCPLLCRYQLWLCCIFHSFVFACSAMTRAYHPPHLKSSQCVPLSDRFPSCKTRI